MKQGAQWLDRTLHDLQLHFALCLDEATYLREVRRLKVKNAVPFPVKPHQGAKVVFFTNSEGGNIAIVCLPPPRPGIVPGQIYAILVHEAVHIWREHLRLIGEKKPSEEFECYGIQAISQRLICAYLDAQKKPRPKPRRRAAAKKKPKPKPKKKGK